MNSNLSKEKNLILFNKRFPELSKLLGPVPDTFDELSLIESKSGMPTVKENNVFLHSVYNPVREAEKAIKEMVSDSTLYDAFVFLGFGLGYGPITFAKSFPEKTLILIEPDYKHLIFAFSALDWEPVLNLKSVIFFIQASTDQVIPILENIGLEKCYFIQNHVHTIHNSEYFSSINKLIERNKQKKKINDRTLEVFSHLWMRNMCTNLKEIVNKRGINTYKNKVSGIPAVVLAAGPSLETILPYLEKIKERAILICVDTALKACLSYGIQPHFIILCDPQYWNSRHLDRLNAPESILITEIAAYPSIFRFNCKEIKLCSSLFTLANFFETRVESKGKLSSGGSVSSSAWDFARFIGCNKIFMAGLDLGFPHKHTHVKGSTFEEKTHTESNRINNAETKSVNALYSASVTWKKDYNDKPILSDNRMSMYAWWFESKAMEYPNIHTYSLTADSLAIPGILKSDINELLSFPKIKDFKLFTNNKEPFNDINDINDKYDKTLVELFYELDNLLKIAQSALKTAETGINIIQTIANGNISCEVAKRLTDLNSDLSKYDKKIMSTPITGLPSLLFPTPAQFEKIVNNSNSISDNIINTSNQEIEKYYMSYKRSIIIYKTIISSIENCIIFLKKTQKNN